MKWVLIILAIVVGLILIAILVGYLLPVRHTASVRVSVNAASAAVWQRITNVQDYPSWRKDLDSVEISSDSEWVEVNRRQRLPMKRVVFEPVHRMVGKINGKNLPFGGTWEFILEPRGPAATEVTITENGEVYNPFFRFVSKFIMGHTASLKKYAGYLRGSFD